MPTPPHVAFICSGNICRSPMAEAIARHLLEQWGREATASSAGTLGIEDHPASRRSAEALEPLGIDLDGHRSRGVSAKYLRAADAIVVMSEEHVGPVLAHDPSSQERIHRLWEHTDVPGRLEEIADPVGCGPEAFATCRDDLLECVENWLSAFLASVRSRE